jgi:hypothetical protein
VHVIVLEGDREGEDVEAAEVRTRLERGEGQPPAFQLGAVGVVGQEGALADHAGDVVEHLVDGLEAEVRHPDEVEVRVGEGDPDLAPPLRGAEADLGLAKALVAFLEPAARHG